MKALVYARFSSNNQNEGSITAQLRAIQEYSHKNGIIILHEYVDEALSGTTDNRPQFLQMIDDVTAGRYEVDLILVHKLDRFARNRYDSAIYRHELQKKNVRLIAVDQPLDDSPEGIILTSLLEGMAEYYSKNLSREVKKGMRENALQAKHRGGRPPLGYDVDRETMKYVVNPQEAEAVKLIFKMAVEFHSMMEISQELNRRGYRSKLGRPFPKHSIHDILENPKYAGNYVANRYCGEKEFTLAGEVPAIVDQQTWTEVQQIMESRKLVAPRKKSKNGSDYILTGKMFCGECGAAYTGNFKIGGRGYKYKSYYYICVNKKQRKSCDNPNLIREQIENYVLDEIEAAFGAANAEKFADLIEKKYKEQAKSNAGEIDRLKKAINALSSRIENLFDAIETKTMPTPVAGARLTELSVQKDTFESQLAGLEQSSTIPYTREQIIKFVTLQQDALGKRDNLDECKKLINRYIERVTIFKDEIEIKFKIKNPPDPNQGDGRVYVKEPFGSTILDTTKARTILNRYSGKSIKLDAK
jgi:site-specific DNA recombinase